MRTECCGPGSSTRPGCSRRPRSGRATWARSSTASRRGRYTFMAGQAHAVATGKAPAKRNAEIHGGGAGRPLAFGGVASFAPAGSRSSGIHAKAAASSPARSGSTPGRCARCSPRSSPHGCNLGLYTMEKVAPDIAYRRLKYVSDWRLVEENQRAALGAIVHGISRLDAAGHWGDGTTSASDGQRFAMPQKVLQRTYSTRFNDFALEFYSFVYDNYAPVLQPLGRAHRPRRALRARRRALPRERPRPRRALHRHPQVLRDQLRGLRDGRHAVLPAPPQPAPPADLLRRPGPRPRRPRAGPQARPAGGELPPHRRAVGPHRPVFYAAFPAGNAAASADGGETRTPGIAAMENRPGCSLRRRRTPLPDVLPQLALWADVPVEVTGLMPSLRHSSDTDVSRCAHRGLRQPHLGFDSANFPASGRLREGRDSGPISGPGRSSFLVGEGRACRHQRGGPCPSPPPWGGLRARAPVRATVSGRRGKRPR